MMNNDSLGDRMKCFEKAFNNTQFPPRMPIILRVDGKGFHSYTKRLPPFCKELENVMNETALALCKNIQGAQLSYIQSDEISVLIYYHIWYNSQPWFDNKVQKIISVSASIASAIFTANSDKIWKGEVKPAFFDSRAFILPKEEVPNYFLWRQLDWTRNSIQMHARSIFSHKQCHQRNISELKEMCIDKGKSWEDLSWIEKNGRCTTKVKGVWEVTEPPLFKKNKLFFDQFMVQREGRSDDSSVSAPAVA